MYELRISSSMRMGTILRAMGSMGTSKRLAEKGARRAVSHQLTSGQNSHQAATVSKSKEEFHGITAGTAKM
jgi:hypothetical protein